MNLKDVAAKLQNDLAMNRRPNINDENQPDVQVLCIAEEAGELVGAYRRWTGRARRIGTKSELKDEVADVLIVTAIFAELVGIDIDRAVQEKLAKIYARGWAEG